MRHARLRRRRAWRRLDPRQLRFALHGGYLHKPSDRFLWYTDGMQFMNHRRAPRGQRRARHLAAALATTTTVALRDIAAGEELLEDYTFWADGGLAPTTGSAGSISSTAPSTSPSSGSLDTLARGGLSAHGGADSGAGSRDQLLEDDRLGEDAGEARLLAGAADLARRRSRSPPRAPVSASPTPSARIAAAAAKPSSRGICRSISTSRGRCRAGHLDALAAVAAPPAARSRACAASRGGSAR